MERVHYSTNFISECSYCSTEILHVCTTVAIKHHCTVEMFYGAAYSIAFLRCRKILGSEISYAHNGGLEILYSVARVNLVKSIMSVCTVTQVSTSARVQRKIVQCATCQDGHVSDGKLHIMPLVNMTRVRGNVQHYTTCDDGHVSNQKSYSMPRYNMDT